MSIMSARQAEYSRRMQELFDEFHATPDELCAILGSGWAICRKTPRNLASHARCITPREYEAAQCEALARRKGR